MSTVVPTQIVDRNGKQTTVNKKTDGAPKPSPRPIPAPLSRQQTIDPDQRVKDAVRDLFTRLNIGGSDISASDVKEVDKNIYSVVNGATKLVAFDDVQVGGEYVSGVVTKTDGGVVGSLHLGNGTSSQTDARGYALPSTEASVETQVDATKIALPYL